MDGWAAELCAVCFVLACSLIFVGVLAVSGFRLKEGFLRIPDPSLGCKEEVTDARPSGRQLWLLQEQEFRLLQPNMEPDMFQRTVVSAEHILGFQVTLGEYYTRSPKP